MRPPENRTGNKRCRGRQNVHLGRDGKADGKMAQKVVWAYAVEEDLDAAAAYLHRGCPAYAGSFVNRALQADQLSCLRNAGIRDLDISSGRDNLSLPQPFQKLLPVDRQDVRVPGCNRILAHQEEIREYLFLGKRFETFEISRHHP